jgi:hypothetical protein
MAGSTILSRTTSRKTAPFEGHQRYSVGLPTRARAAIVSMVTAA